MFSNYKLFFRSLKKHKLYSFINIAGLAIGLASFLLILQYVLFEFSFDSFWKNSDNIYRVKHEQYQNGERQITSARTFSGLGEAMLNEIPGVKNYTKFYQDEVMCYTDENKVRLNNQNLYWVDTTFLDVFNLQFVHGSAQTAFSNFFSSIISRSAAQKLFGNENPIGKWYKVNEGWAFCVTGVFNDIPSNSHIKMDFIVSTSSLWYYFTNWDNATGQLRAERTIPTPTHYTDRWQWYGADTYTYISISPNTNVSQVENKMSALFNKYCLDIIHNGGKVKLSLQKIKDIHLSSNLQFELKVNGDKTLTVALLITSIIILLIAWINYVNLSIVKSMDRSKETALRKVVGADRFQLIRQYISESVFVNIAAIILALIFVGTVSIMFPEISGSYLHKGLLNLNFWMIIAAFLFIGTMLSGIYPAFVLSSFKPVHLLKEKSSAFSSHAGIRKLLVGFQFVIAIILITVTLVVYLQIDFLQNQKLGCNIDQVIFMRSPYTMIKKPQRLERLQSFKNELMRISSIKNFAASSSIPGEEIMMHRDDIRKAGSTPNQKSDYTYLNVDEDFLPTYKINLLAGRNFQTNNNEEHSVIINEQAAKQLGFKNPQNAINELLQAGDTQFRIVGVSKDYHHEYLKKPITPTIFFYGYNWHLDVGYYSVKVSSKNIKTSINEIEKVWKGIYPEDPFNYFFLDEQYAKQYEADQQFGTVFTLFSFLSLCLTLFGLFGLTSYTFIKRTKEIGIRKVLGGSVAKILVLLTKDIVRWIVISNVIAIPIAWYAINKWLDNFAYRIDVTWWMFALSGVIALVIALATVSFQAIKAATANPVESLKYE